MRFLNYCRRVLTPALTVALVVPFIIPTESIARYSGVRFNENTEVCEKEGYLGHYDKTDNSITLCTDNYDAADIERVTVVKHEVIHRIQCNIGVKEVLPERILSYVVDATVPDKDVLAVLLYYQGPDRKGEFEARVFQNLPQGLISGTLFYTNIYRTIRKAIT